MNERSLSEIKENIREIQLGQALEARNTASFRDQLAMAALHLPFTFESGLRQDQIKEIAKYAYEFADAMLKERLRISDETT